MNFKDRWHNWSSTKRGAFAGCILGILFLSYTLFGSYICEKGYGPRSEYFGCDVAIAIGIIVLFLLIISGMIVGWIIGKINNKTINYSIMGGITGILIVIVANYFVFGAAFSKHPFLSYYQIYPEYRWIISMLYLLIPILGVFIGMSIGYKKSRLPK